MLFNFDNTFGKYRVFPSPEKQHIWFQKNSKDILHLFAVFSYWIWCKVYWILHVVWTLTMDKSFIYIKYIIIFNWWIENETYILKRPGLLGKILRIPTIDLNEPVKCLYSIWHCHGLKQPSICEMSIVLHTINLTLKFKKLKPTLPEIC